MLLDEAPESPAVSTVLRNTRLTLEMIKIEHTLFALPFAFLGAVWLQMGSRL
jgi:4-hydroxybenzoate polyprenyltransferase